MADLETVHKMWGHEMQDILTRVSTGATDPTDGFFEMSHLFHTAQEQTRTMLRAEFETKK